MTTDMHPPAQPRRPSDLLVEQWRLGELDPAEARRVARALEVFDDPRRRPTDEEDAALFERLPPEDLELEVLRRAELADRRDAARERAATRSAGGRAWALAPAALLLVALLGLLVWRGGWSPRSDAPLIAPGLDGDRIARRVETRDVQGPGDTRIKGQRPQLIARVERGGELRRIDEGQTVSAGEVVQLSYVAAGHGHGVIVSIDGRGGVTLHLPSEPTQDTRLVQRKETPIGHSYQLDDAPGFERFIFVTADATIDPREILAAAEALARDGSEPARRDRLVLSPDLHQASLVVHKGD